MPLCPICRTKSISPPTPNYLADNLVALYFHLLKSVGALELGQSGTDLEGWTVRRMWVVLSFFHVLFFHSRLSQWRSDHVRPSSRIESASGSSDVDPDSDENYEPGLEPEGSEAD
jgi:hypothetical protein